MGKIRLFIASSLDGYIARTSGAVDWLFTDADYGYSEFFTQIGAVIMGRKTYEQVLSFGEYPYSGKQSFVASKTLVNQRDKNVQFVGDNLSEFITEMQASSSDDSWLVGGGELIYHFLLNGWIDELILAIHPIILGAGIPLITADPNLETVLDLQKVKAYESGLVQVSYNVLKKPV